MVKAMVSAAFSSAVFPQLAVTLPAGNEETNGLLQRLLGVDSDPAQDLIDQQVACFLRKNPEAKGRHKIKRVRPNTYLLDNREVQIVWQYATEPGGQGFLVVVDGLLRQPFSDYMRDTEENALRQLGHCSKQFAGHSSGPAHVFH